MIQENLIGGRAGFANAGDVNRGMILQRAGIFAGAAANTFFWIDAGLLEDLGLAFRVYDLGGLKINGFG